MSLEREKKTYKEKLPELREHVGQYALIKGEEVVDLFGSYEDALRDGYRRFGMEPFLVKMIEGDEGVHFITRDVDLVPAI